MSSAKWRPFCPVGEEVKLCLRNEYEIQQQEQFQFMYTGCDYWMTGETESAIRSHQPSALPCQISHSITMTS